jgi:hypothetical protein
VFLDVSIPWSLCNGKDPEETACLYDFRLGDFAVLSSTAISLPLSELVELIREGVESG